MYMDWTTPLKLQQFDFIKRLKVRKLLHSELILISGEKLKKLYNFSFKMAYKYKNKDLSNIENIFKNNAKGKLGEVALKALLADFITEVNYDETFGGDGKVDFTLTSNSKIGIQVKTRHGQIDTVEWSISKEEVEKNSVLVCMLTLENVTSEQREYNVVSAGFLPTSLIKEDLNKLSFTIDELLYSGDLYSYLKDLEPAYYFEIGCDFFYIDKYSEALINFKKVLEIDSECSKAYTYSAFCYLGLEKYSEAFVSCNKALEINPNDEEAKLILDEVLPIYLP